MEQQNSNAVATVTEQNAVTQELLGDYLKTLTNQLTTVQRNQFIAVAQAFGLNPFKREIYAVTFKNKDGGTDLSIVTGYEVYLKRAELNPNYDGFDIEFRGGVKRTTVTKKGKYGDYEQVVVVPDGDFSCVCTVYRKDRNHPIVEEVFFDEFNQGNSMWQSKPRLMLKKVAIANAFRKAFPVEFGGMPYTSDELPDNMTGADKLNAQGYTEVQQAQPATPKTEAPKAAKTQDEKDANWLAMCDELRERNPGIFDNYLKQHNVPDLAEIHNSKERQKLYTDIKATIDFAEKEANNG